MHPYERWTIRRYLANALKSSRFARPPTADREIVTWIESHSRLLGLPELASGTLSSRRRLAIEAPMQFGALEGMACRCHRHRSRVGAEALASSKAPRLACAGVFAHRRSEPSPRSFGASDAERPRSAVLSRRSTTVRFRSTWTVRTFSRSSRRTPSGSSSRPEADFPNWV